MKAYKGFNKDMTCRDFQFEEGKEYETNRAELCKEGFHACENPLDCFNYYAPGSSVFHEVEIEDNGQRNKTDTKMVGKKIKIGARLNVEDMCKAHFEFVKSHTTIERTDLKIANVKDWSSIDTGYGGSVNAGKYSSANMGDWSSANVDYGSATKADEHSSINAGDYSSANASNWSSVNIGNRSSINAGSCSSVNAGDYSLANVGNWSTVNVGYRGTANAGDYSSAKAGDWGSANVGYLSFANAGDNGIANAGDYSSATSRGSASVGKGGIAIARGSDCRIKGEINSIILIAEESADYYDIVSWKAAVVDGKIIKADTWYKLKDGELVEVKGD